MYIFLKNKTIVFVSDYNNKKQTLNGTDITTNKEITFNKDDIINITEEICKNIIID